ALEHYEQAARAFSARGDLLGLSDVLRSKGRILDWRKGEYVEAERLHREALSYVGEEHRRQRAALLARLARDQLSAGNTTAAQALYREALAIYEAEADRQGQLETLLNPGSWLYHSTGDFLQALAVLRRAEQLALELGSSRNLVEAYNNMSVNLYFLGRYPESLDYSEKALALSRELGEAHGEAYALMNQANAFEITCAMGYTDLYQQYQRALRMEQASGDRRFTIAILVFMMIFARRGGDVSEAIRRGQQALPLATERGLRWLTGFVLIQLGAAQIWIDPDASRAALDEALQIFGDCGDHYHLTASHFWQAVLYHSENNPAYLDHLRECLRLAVGHHYDYFFRCEVQAAIPLLAAALEHGLWPSYAAPILAKIGSRAVASLRPLLAHPDEEVRRRAESVLNELGFLRDGWRVTSDAPPDTRHPTPVPRPPKVAAIPPLTIRGVFSPDHTLPKDAAIDLLWGEADPPAANANFYRALYNLRRTLEPMSPHSGANYLALEGGLLKLAGDGVHRIDVDDFVRGVEEGRALARAGDPAAARDRLSAAVRLYVDDLSTDDLYDDWLQPRREQLRDQYLNALCDLADLATRAGQIDLAIYYLRQAFRKDSTHEAACLKLMVNLAKTGHRAEALQHFAACEKALAELGLTPSEELRAAQHDLLAVRVTLPTPLPPSLPDVSA
ncbi:MAG: hypothetical protein HY023_01160, partial [Chloroflexi bacterium]|nr:hypothetical protein [Chloroflexota bacterium]